MTINATLKDVTARIIKRSTQTRAAYLAAVESQMREGPRRMRLTEGNLAHASAACPLHDKTQLFGAKWPNIGIITAYNDMLSAHQPFEKYPEIIRKAARKSGAVAQVAGGVPAMCDGVTQGQDGMELSLFSRDVIAMSAAVGLSHDMFDAALYLGVCDKIVPGLIMAALRFGWVPAVFIPAGPMPSGLPNSEKARIRQEFAQGKVGRAALLKAEAESYHSPGTCTFYGTANSNQMLMEIMGLQLPGSSFINPNTPLRDAMTEAGVARAAQITSMGNEYTPPAYVVDEKAIVNGMAGLMATGGSTNLAIHIIAIARAAGIIINWDDLSDISKAVPLICKIYPNGLADVNHFHAAGGMGYLIAEMLSSGLLHDDVKTIAGEGGIARYTQEPVLDGDSMVYRAAPSQSLDPEILSHVDKPFRHDGGLSLIKGNLGRAVSKVSAVSAEHQKVSAPAMVFDNQNALMEAFKAGQCERDFIAVIRFQGPAANGMPELHKLTPVLGALQDKGFQIALVTDGRMSGASGKVPSAIHMCPEALHGGPIGRVRDGDMMHLDCEAGTLHVDVAPAEFEARPLAEAPKYRSRAALGMNMFGAMRRVVSSAEEGATILGTLEDAPLHTRDLTKAPV
ncbi:phosphogluconate dehydratase [Robiginitomaculum antarcticum]|uniref:phosphogluconate dehydratase n=1 Tax=Robiginitomaculum antarcticum TaxID=437507 RepID=UPI000369250C|nr:phosphogluconate dehydratase [Robiginitomaculum antarcticum]